MQGNRQHYLATVENLILQSMVKMIEPELQIKCRNDDVKDIKAFTAKLEKQYKEFMNENTGRDEYECNLIVLEDNNLT